MIDKDTLRTARRTVERNGFTVLPPRENDERALNRFRTRREVQREEREDLEDRPARPARPAPRYRDVVEQEPVRTRPAPRPHYRDEEEVEDRPVRRFKPLRGRDVEPVDDYEDRPVRQTRVPREIEDEYEDRPVRSSRFDRPNRPVRREMNDDEKLGAAIRTAEENGFTIRKMSKLDQAKQVARDNGFSFRRLEDDDEDVPASKPVRTLRTNRVEDQTETPRASAERPQRPLVRNRHNAPVDDGIRTRTAPDTEIKNDTVPAPAAEPTPTETKPEPKKNTYADDFMNRAARFFGDDND